MKTSNICLVDVREYVEKNALVIKLEILVKNIVGMSNFNICTFSSKKQVIVSRYFILSFNLFTLTFFFILFLCFFLFIPYFVITSRLSLIFFMNSYLFLGCKCIWGVNIFLLFQNSHFLMVFFL